MPSPEVAACTRELVKELKALACAALARLDPAAETARQTAEATHGDPSVFDAFYYFNRTTSGQRNINMGEWSGVSHHYPQHGVVQV
jgi:precorrin-2 methylase